MDCLGANFAVNSAKSRPARGHERPRAWATLLADGPLVVNIDNKAGKTLVEDALRTNTGPMALLESTARSAHEQLTQVAAVVREAPLAPEILGPIRRRFIRSLLS